MSAATLDNCPSCGRRITDTDPLGMEAPDGQRWCIAHHVRDWWPEVCASCGFGTGDRTGGLCRYNVPDRPAFGDWRGRQGVLLCADCVAAAPGVLHPVEAPEGEL